MLKGLAKGDFYQKLAMKFNNLVMSVWSVCHQKLDLVLHNKGKQEKFKVPNQIKTHQVIHTSVKLTLLSELFGAFEPSLPMV